MGGSFCDKIERHLLADHSGQGERAVALDCTTRLPWLSGAASRCRFPRCGRSGGRRASGTATGSDRRAACVASGQPGCAADDKIAWPNPARSEVAAERQSWSVGARSGQAAHWPSRAGQRNDPRRRHSQAIAPKELRRRDCSISRPAGTAVAPVGRAHPTRARLAQEHHGISRSRGAT